MFLPIRLNIVAQYFILLLGHDENSLSDTDADCGQCCSPVLNHRYEWLLDQKVVQKKTTIHTRIS